MWVNLVTMAFSTPNPQSEEVVATQVLETAAEAAAEAQEILAADGGDPAAAKQKKSRLAIGLGLGIALALIAAVAGGMYVSKLGAEEASPLRQIDRPEIFGTGQPRYVRLPDGTMRAVDEPDGRKPISHDKN